MVSFTISGKKNKEERFFISPVGTETVSIQCVEGLDHRAAMLCALTPAGLKTFSCVKNCLNVKVQSKERQIASHTYNAANLALFFYGFEKKAPALKKLHLLPVALGLDMLASLVSAKASFSDKTTDHATFRPFELGKAFSMLVATVVLTFGIYKNKPTLSFIASGLYVVQALFLTADGVKEKDGANFSAGILSVMASVFMAFLKK